MLRDGTTVYVLGPMTGYPLENRQAFRSAVAQLRADYPGINFISPDELDQIDPLKEKDETEEGLWVRCIRRDLPWLATAHLGVALRGWQTSKGATLEALTLNQLGLPILRWPEMTVIPPEELPVPTFLGATK